LVVLAMGLLCFSINAQGEENLHLIIRFVKTRRVASSQATAAPSSPSLTQFRFRQAAASQKPIHVGDPCNADNSPCYYRVAPGSTITVSNPGEKQNSVSYVLGEIRNGLDRIPVPRGTKDQAIKAITNQNHPLSCNRLNCFDVVLKPAQPMTSKTEPCGSVESLSAEQMDNDEKPVLCEVMLPQQVNQQENPLYELVIVERI